MEEFLYGELTGKIIGILYKVYNQLGPGLQEKYYQRAIAEELREIKISFEQEKAIPLLYVYGGKNIGKHILDFLIDNKIILELKAGHLIRIVTLNKFWNILKSPNVL